MDDKDKVKEKSNVISLRGDLPAPVDVEPTPEEVLLEAIEMIKSGEIKATQIAIVALDKGVSEDDYNVHIKNSLMRSSELISLFEVAKRVMIEEVL